MPASTAVITRRRFDTPHPAAGRLVGYGAMPMTRDIPIPMTRDTPFRCPEPAHCQPDVCQPDVVKGQLSWPFSFPAVNTFGSRRHAFLPERAYGLRRCR